MTIAADIAAAYAEGGADQSLLVQCRAVLDALNTAGYPQTITAGDITASITSAELIDDGLALALNATKSGSPITLGMNPLVLRQPAFTLPDTAAEPRTFAFNGKTRMIIYPRIEDPVGAIRACVLNYAQTWAMREG